MGGSAGIGYGPGSLSSSYSKVTGTIGCPAPTATNGMPIGPPFHRPLPKSAFNPEPEPILATKASLFAWRGSAETSACQKLSLGKEGQPATVDPEPIVFGGGGGGAVVGGGAGAGGTVVVVAVVGGASDVLVVASSVVDVDVLVVVVEVVELVDVGSFRAAPICDVGVAEP